MKDESDFLLLNDTSLMNVQLRYPDGTLRQFYFNTDTLIFTPATSGANNTASVDFTPYLTDDGTYQLIIHGKDKSGNTAGNVAYTVSFEVYNKPMITNMFNYPNPFTTSTAFVFTVTGSQVPQNIRIQILTITGKIVREITKEELGRYTLAETLQIINGMAQTSMAISLQTEFTFIVCLQILMVNHLINFQRMDRTVLK